VHHRTAFKPQAAIGGWCAVTPRRRRIGALAQAAAMQTKSRLPLRSPMLERLKLNLRAWADAQISSSIALSKRHLRKGSKALKKRFREWLDQR